MATNRVSSVSICSSTLLLLLLLFVITLHSAGLLSTIDHAAAETSTWQHTTLTRDKPPCPQWDSNPQSQQASGSWHRLTRETNDVSAATLQ